MESCGQSNRISLFPLPDRFVDFSGMVRIATLVHGIHRKKQKYGMVTMCIGTGMGAAGISEAL
jgi:hypothetical protein